MEDYKMKRSSLFIILSFLLLAGNAFGTQYWSELEIQKSEELESPGIKSLSPKTGELFGETSVGYDYLLQYGKVAHFLSTLQVDSIGHPEYGGMREAEHMPEIVETDNTAEAIWIWSHYYELTGDTTYLPNIQKAWQYVMNYPAYNEEGGGGSHGYYRIYNCGWAMASEMKYRNVFGDTTYKWYGDSCASYTVLNPLNIYYLNLYGLVQAWAAGNLYLFGVEQNDTTFQNSAINYGAEIKNWIEINPYRLAYENWAMAGGAAMWGILNSYFPAHPEETKGWLETFAPYLETYVPGGSFQNAWNGWYALGHYAVWEELASPLHKKNHKALTDTLIADDEDGDGGIPANRDEPDDHDQSWVTSYLGFMGINSLLQSADLALCPDTVSVPQEGELGFTITIANNRDTTQTLWVLTEVTMPNGEPYPGNPVLGPKKIVLQPNRILQKHVVHPVPPNAPLGTYTYTAKIGQPPSNLIDSDSFFFTMRE